ncbi:unnamed protein product, partial [marine sediment metagenome]
MDENKDIVTGIPWQIVMNDCIKTFLQIDTFTQTI